MSISDNEVQRLLEALSPDQQHFAQAVASMKLENRVLTQQIADLKKSYDDLWAILIVVVHAYPEKEMRIHESQFLRFKHEYRIDKTFDKETKEVVLRLLTLHDVPKREEDDGN